MQSEPSEAALTARPAPLAQLHPRWRAIAGAGLRVAYSGAGLFLFILSLALRKAGRRPAEVLFVGDSPEHDIAGARPLGMRTALIVDEGIEPPGQRGDVAQSLTRAHHEIRSLSELVPLACPES